MRLIEVILIVAGILMFIFRGISFTQEKKVVDIGPIEINKKEKKSVQWPTYVAAIALVGGIVLVATSKKDK